MAASGNNPTTGHPLFSNSDAPDIKLDPQLAAEYAAEVGNRIVKSTADRVAYPYAREGLECYDTDLDVTFIHDGSGWVDQTPVDTTVPATTFTASSGVLADAVFDPAFTVHRVTFNITSGSAAAAVYFRFRAGGTTLSSVGTYITQQNYNSSDSTYLAVKDTDDKADLTPAATTSPRIVELLIANAGSASLPTLAQVRGFTWVSSHHVQSDLGVRFTPTSAVDGLTVYPASGTITGSFKVEGVM